MLELTVVPRAERSAEAEATGPTTGPVLPPAPATVNTAPIEPMDTIGPGEVVGRVVTAAVEQVARVVRPDAAVAVASQFTFPLALALAVLAYLVIQGRVDRRDPKLRIAPQHVLETLVLFRTEDEL